LLIGQQTETDFQRAPEQDLIQLTVPYSRSNAIGKQPVDIKMWVMVGEVPTFLRMEGAFYQQGPIWITEVASPVWPQRTK
jgi:hypothetical protein